MVSWLYSLITVQFVGNLEPLAGDAESFANEVTKLLEDFRRLDGGSARTSEGGSGSTYHSFLVVLCYEMLGRTAPDAAGIERFLLARRRNDGGFVEIGPMKCSGTNPTAAAAVLLKRSGVMDAICFRRLEAG